MLNQLSHSTKLRFEVRLRTDWDDEKKEWVIHSPRMINQFRASTGHSPGIKMVNRRVVPDNCVRYRAEHSRVLWHGTYSKNDHSIIDLGLKVGGLNGAGKDGVYFSVRNSDAYTQRPRAGKDPSEMKQFVDEPYYFDRATTSLVMVDGQKAVLMGCFMYQLPAFSVLSRDNIPTSCIIAIINRTGGAVRYINPLYNTTQWKNYWTALLSKAQRAPRPSAASSAAPSTAPRPPPPPPDYPRPTGSGTRPSAAPTVDPLAPSQKNGKIHPEFERIFQRISQTVIGNYLRILDIEQMDFGDRCKAHAKKARDLITIACHPDKSPSAPREHCTIIIEKVMRAYEKAQKMLPE